MCVRILLITFLASRPSPPAPSCGAARRHRRYHVMIPHSCLSYNECIAMNITLTITVTANRISISSINVTLNPQTKMRKLRTSESELGRNWVITCSA